MNRRSYWYAGLWSLSAAALIFLAWWRDSTLNFVGSRSDALALWLQLAAWGLTLLLAAVLGWRTRAEHSTRNATLLVSVSVAVFGVLVVVAIGALNVFASYFATLSYSELLVLSLIFVLGPSAVLFLSAWLVRGLADRLNRGRQPRTAPVAAEGAQTQENKL